MKKLTTLFILLFVGSLGLFAEPKVPKYFYGDSEFKEDKYIYISNDLMYCYEIQAINVNDTEYPYKLNFIKRSLLVDTSMFLAIYFENENQLDNFTKNIHLSDIENEFERIRKRIINANVKSSIQLSMNDEYFDYENRPNKVIYMAYNNDL